MSHNNETKTKQTIKFERALIEIRRLWTGWNLKKNDNRPGTSMIVKEKCKNKNPRLFLCSPADALRFIDFSEDGQNELQAHYNATNGRHKISKEFILMYNIKKNEDKWTNKSTKVSTSNSSDTKTSTNNSKITEIGTGNGVMSSTSNNTRSWSKRSSYKQIESPVTNSRKIVDISSSEESVEVNSDEQLSKDDNYRTICAVSSSRTSRSSSRDRQKRKYNKENNTTRTTQPQQQQGQGRERQGRQRRRQRQQRQQQQASTERPRQR